VRFVLLPIYTAFVLLNIRLERVIVSARGLFFFLFTNRYIFHAALLIVSIATIGSQLTTPSASASDSAQNSLLYTLVTQGQDESIEETFYIEPAQGKTSYLGADTIQALPDIDYGYDTDIVADLTIPGSVELETDLHRLFKSYHLSGEWFNYADEIRHFVSGAAFYKNRVGS
jgi:hypothetical protein